MSGKEKKKRPRVEDLLLPRLLQVIARLEAADGQSLHLEIEGELPRLPTHEAETRQALSPLMQGMVHPLAGPSLIVASMARTAVLFLVDHDEFQQVTNSAGPELPFVGLPPLPYPRIAVECDEDKVWKLMHDGEYDHDLELILINEQEQGERWTVVFLLREAEEITKPRMQIFMIEKDGSVRYLRRKGDDVEKFPTPRTMEELQSFATVIEGRIKEEVAPPDDPGAKALRLIPLELVHMLNARGVTIDPLEISRAQRRRFDRYHLTHPRVYFVYVGNGTSESEIGHGDRQYHCRWLVRGHWRHRKNRRSWVRPYIKGPAGAPWRGRPVYIVGDPDDYE